MESKEMRAGSVLDKVPKKQLRTKNQPLATRVADQLTAWIVDGTLRPGARLNEIEIADKLGVSRIPVREAFRTLENSGLVIMVPYHGCHVRDITPEMVTETYVLRKELECLALLHAAEKITPQEIAHLKKMQDGMEEYVQQSSINGWKLYHLNKDFHMSIYEASGMPRLALFIESLWNSIACLRIRRAFDQSYPDVMRTEHRAYIHWLEQRDGKSLCANFEKNLSKHYQDIYNLSWEYIQDGQENAKDGGYEDDSGHSQL